MSVRNLKNLLMRMTMRKEKAAEERRAALDYVNRLQRQARQVKHIQQQPRKSSIQIQVGAQPKPKQSSKQSSKQQSSKQSSKQSAAQERRAAIDQVISLEAQAKQELVRKLSNRINFLKGDGIDVDIDLSRMGLAQLQKLDSGWDDIVARATGQDRNVYLDLLKSFFKLQGYVTKKLGDATVDTAVDTADILSSIVDALGQIIEILQSYAPALREILDELGPALKQFNDLIVKPYLGLVKDTEATMQKFKEDAQAGRLDPDALTPPISGPWKDWKRVAAISTAVNLPLVGPVRKAMIGTVGMARYQAATGRGWPSEFEMMQWAAGQPGILGPAMSVADALPAGKIPLWFLKN